RFLDSAEEGEGSPADRAFFNRGTRDFELVQTDVAPDEHAMFQLRIERYPWWLGDPLSSDTSDDWIYDRIEVDRDYLRLLTLGQLRIFRNTFFAQAGYDFGEGELGRYFGRFRWYDPRTSDIADMLNETEERNVEIIQEEEQRRRSFVSP
ncbi:MAG: YARHG domain-containing protein, partial [Spirochaetia bacterium]